MTNVNLRRCLAQLGPLVTPIPAHCDLHCLVFWILGVDQQDFSTLLARRVKRLLADDSFCRPDVRWCCHLDINL